MAKEKGYLRYGLFHTKMAFFPVKLRAAIYNRWLCCKVYNESSYCYRRNFISTINWIDLLSGCCALVSQRRFVFPYDRPVLYRRNPYSRQVLPRLSPWDWGQIKQHSHHPGLQDWRFRVELATSLQLNSVSARMDPGDRNSFEICSAPPTIENSRPTLVIFIILDRVTMETNSDFLLGKTFGFLTKPCQPVEIFDLIFRLHVGLRLNH